MCAMEIAGSIREWFADQSLLRRGTERRIGRGLAEG